MSSNHSWQEVSTERPKQSVCVCLCVYSCSSCTSQPLSPSEAAMFVLCLISLSPPRPSRLCVFIYVCMGNTEGGCVLVHTAAGVCVCVSAVLQRWPCVCVCSGTIRLFFFVSLCRLRDVSVWGDGRWQSGWIYWLVIDTLVCREGALSLLNKAICLSQWQRRSGVGRYRDYTFNLFVCLFFYHVILRVFNHWLVVPWWSVMALSYRPGDRNNTDAGGPGLKPTVGTRIQLFNRLCWTSCTFHPSSVSWF